MAIRTVLLYSILACLPLSSAADGLTAYHTPNTGFGEVEPVDCLSKADGTRSLECGLHNIQSDLHAYDPPIQIPGTKPWNAPVIISVFPKSEQTQVRVNCVVWTTGDVIEHIYCP